MDKIKDLWLDFEIALEDKMWLKGLVIGLIAIIVLFIGSKVIIGRKDKVLEEEALEEVIEEGEFDISTEEYVSVDEESVYILENPDDYSEAEVKKAFNTSVITLDHPFIEDKLFLGEELEDGVYVYYEKVSEDYKGILGLVVEMDNIGVPIKIYTPHRDQSIANISNHTMVNKEGEIEYIGLVVREGEVKEKYNNTEEWKRYLRGVINENKQ